MLIAQDLTKQFNTREVVKNISFKIKEGEIVGLLGPNGAGKTTTLRMIAGVLPPTDGSITLDGKNVIDTPEQKSKIGFLPENNPLYFDMLVSEYLEFWSNIKGLTGATKKDAIDFVVKSCGISDVYYRPIGELSKGYKQRVGLSQAILTKPDLLILDEPTEGLDPNQRHDIANLITELGKKRTVIISSHVLSELARITNRMIIINQGEIVADDTPENLRSAGGKKNMIEVEVTGRNVEKTLAKIKGVKKVDAKKEGMYVIEAEGKNDIREEIFKTAVAKKWKLLTLYRRESDMEEVFSRLTQK